MFIEKLYIILVDTVVKLLAFLLRIFEITHSKT